MILQYSSSRLPDTASSAFVGR